MLWLQYFNINLRFGELYGAHPYPLFREGLISLSAYPWRFGKSDLWRLHLSSSVSASHWLSLRSHLNSSIMWMQPAGELSSSRRKNTHSLSSRFAARARVTTRMLGPEGFLQMFLFAKWFPLMSAACLSRFVVSHVIVIKVLKINLAVLYLIPLLSISLSTTRRIPPLLARTIQSGTTKLPRIKLLFVHKVPKWYLCDFSSECLPNVNAGGSIDVLERVGRGRRD